VACHRLPGGVRNPARNGNPKIGRRIAFTFGERRDQAIQAYERKTELGFIDKTKIVKKRTRFSIFSH
jgi:hypothetical protein